jgi:hypothetical protein
MWLIVVLLFLVLLYFWLRGHWYARVLMFLVLIPAGYAGLGLAVVFTAYDPTVAGAKMDPAMGFVLFGAGAVVAWFVSGIPIYVRVGQQRATENIYLNQVYTVRSERPERREPTLARPIKLLK